MIARSTLRGPRTGLTLVELLVVIAIVAVLVGLIIPALQSARESARRGHCQNNMRQWGLAMQQHESAIGRFAPGSLSETYGMDSSNRRTFVVSLWPYLDAQAILGTYDILQPMWAPVNEAAVDAQVPVYYCPSDRPGARWRGDGYARTARGNYVCNWGNNFFRGINKSGPFSDYELPRTSPLADPGLRRQYGRAAGAFLDGLSNTIFMSEILVTPKDTDRDVRGYVMNNIACGPTFMTRATPNPPSPPYPITPAGRPDADHCWCTQVPPLTEPATCESNINGPAGSGITAVSPGNPNGWNAARSRHPGGVTTLLGDGSTRFVADRISLAVWQQYGTIANSELVEELP